MLQTLDVVSQPQFPRKLVSSDILNVAVAALKAFHLHRGNGALGSWHLPHRVWICFWKTFVIIKCPRYTIAIIIILKHVLKSFLSGGTSTLL